MHPLTITAEAEADAEDASMWHERKRQNLGIEFLVQVGLAIRRIRENPEHYGRVYGQLRRAPVHGFRYGIFFRLTNGHVKVLAVIHNRRSPRAWMKRR
jgi:plasmid stabilization system protein ParE